MTRQACPTTTTPWWPKSCRPTIPEDQSTIETKMMCCPRNHPFERTKKPSAQERRAIMFWKRGNTNRIGRDCRSRSAMFEGLEHRLLFASISTGTDSIGKVITFTGGDGANTVTITDDGGGNVRVSGSGLTSGTQ